MKNMKFTIVVSSVFAMGCLAGCNTGGTPTIEKCKVTFDYYNGEITDVVEVDKGSKVEEKSAAFDKFTFLGWYEDKEYNYKFNFNNPIYVDTTLYGRWKANPSDLKIVAPKTVLQRGESMQLGYTFTLQEEYKDLEIKWSIDDPTYATIDPQTGLLIAKEDIAEAGLVKIKATNEKFKLESPEVEVKIAKSIDFKKTSSGTAALHNFSDVNIDTYTIPSYVELNGEKLVVTEIADDAFNFESNGTEKLNKVIIPNTIQRIGKRAFTKATHIMDVEFEANSSLSIIDAEAFKNLPIKSIVLGKSISQIGESAFEGCYDLSTLLINNESYCVIGSKAFSECTSLTTVDISKVNEIGDEGFYNCPLAKDFSGTEFEHRPLVINNLSKVGTNVFVNNKVTEFKKENITTLTSIRPIKPSDEVEGAPDRECILIQVNYYDLTAKVISVAGRADKKDDLNIKIPNEIIIEFETVSNLNNNEQIKFPIIEIEQNAFYGSEFLEVTISDEIATIGEGAFASCERLRTVHFGTDATLSAIPNNCFQNDYELTKISIPKCVSDIGECAFEGCEALLNPDTTAGLLFESSELAWDGMYEGGIMVEVELSNTNAELNAHYLVNRYSEYSWSKVSDRFSLSDLCLDIDKASSPTYTNIYNLENIFISSADVSFAIDGGSSDYITLSGSTLTVTKKDTSTTQTVKIIAKNATETLDTIDIHIPSANQYELVNSNTVKSSGTITESNLVLPNVASYTIVGSFADATQVNSIEIPEASGSDGYKTISADAFTFTDEAKLKLIKIPSTIETLNSQDLSKCAEGLEIKYNGTKESWNTLTSGKTITLPNNGVVICTDGVIA